MGRPLSLQQRLSEAVGLTAYEAGAYLQMLRSGPLAVSELSRLSGIPRPKCYAVVRSLASKGMCTYTLTHPLRCQAVRPEAALQGQLEQLGEELKRREEEVRDLEKELKQLSTGAEAPSEPLHIHVLKGASSVLQGIRGDLSEAQREVSVASSLTPVPFDWRSLEGTLKEVLQRGVILRYITPSTELFSRRLEAYAAQPGYALAARWLREGRLQLQESKLVHQPFSVFDERVSHLYFTDPERGEVLFALRFEDPRFARYMRTYFQLLWERP